LSNTLSRTRDEAVFQPDLIYDVGLYDGADTANYLCRGYRVVAVDANPLVIEEARLRFSREIQESRLTLLNVGIGNASGSATFWISDHPDWSSFDLAIASRAHTGHKPITVPVVPFAQLIEEHGIPQYLKIDIEGSDKLCLEALKASHLPRFISIESECVGDSRALSDEEATETLELLHDVGYRRFKLVDQARRWLSVRSNATAYLWKRLVNSVAYGGLRIKGLSAVSARFTDYARVSRLGFDFSTGSSGPWGEAVPGDWMPFEVAKSVYLRERHAFFASGGTPYGFWYDWHATADCGSR
jgi:FkbM family methyltransferase